MTREKTRDGIQIVEIDSTELDQLLTEALGKIKILEEKYAGDSLLEKLDLVAGTNEIVSQTNKQMEEKIRAEIEKKSGVPLPNPDPTTADRIKYTEIVKASVSDTIEAQDPYAKRDMLQIYQETMQNIIANKQTTMTGNTQIVKKVSRNGGKNVSTFRENSNTGKKSIQIQLDPPILGNHLSDWKKYGEQYVESRQLMKKQNNNGKTDEYTFTITGDSLSQFMNEVAQAMFANKEAKYPNKYSDLQLRETAYKEADHLMGTSGWQSAYDKAFNKAKEKNDKIESERQRADDRLFHGMNYVASADKNVSSTYPSFEEFCTKLGGNKMLEGWWMDDAKDERGEYAVLGSFEIDGKKIRVENDFSTQPGSGAGLSNEAKIKAGEVARLFLDEGSDGDEINNIAKSADKSIQEGKGLLNNGNFLNWKAEEEEIKNLHEVLYFNDRQGTTSSHVKKRIEGAEKTVGKLVKGSFCDTYPACKYSNRFKVEYISEDGQKKESFQDALINSSSWKNVFAVISYGNTVMEKQLSDLVPKLDLQSKVTIENDVERNMHAVEDLYKSTAGKEDKAVTKLFKDKRTEQDCQNYLSGKLSGKAFESKYIKSVKNLGFDFERSADVYSKQRGIGSGDRCYALISAMKDGEVVKLYNKDGSSRYVQAATFDAEKCVKSRELLEQKKGRAAAAPQPVPLADLRAGNRASRGQKTTNICVPGNVPQASSRRVAHV